MLTDRPPRNAALLAQFLDSDRLGILEVPQDARLRALAESIDSAMRTGKSVAVREACAEFLTLASDFYKVPKPLVRVLAARPVRVREGRWATELFGDYAPEKKLISVWMRTAVRKQVTSFGTFQHPLPRVLPPPRLSALRVSRLSAHAWLLRAHCRALPPRARNANEAVVLGRSARRALADRLAANQSRHLTSPPVGSRQ